MNAGHIEQFAAPADLYQRPATAFVARFLGLDNILPVLSQRDNLAITQIGTFTVTAPAKNLLLHTDFLSIVPNDTHVVIKSLSPSLYTEGGQRGEILDSPTVSATLVQSVFQGDSYRLTLRHASGTILTVKYPAAGISAPNIGDTLAIQIAPNAIIPLAN
jgi:ABC-type Fe3+/spermidine/putrescine transport system ATPase subunit